VRARVIIIRRSEDVESFVMGCLDDKIISDLTRREPFVRLS